VSWGEKGSQLSERRAYSASDWILVCYLFYMQLSTGSKIIEYKKRLCMSFANADRHDIFIMSSSLAYTTALALAPFLLITLSLASLLSHDFQQNIYVGLNNAVGEKIASTILAMIKDADKNTKISGISGAIGFLVLAVSASAIFTNLKIALDKINEHAYKKEEEGFLNFIKGKMFSVGLVFGFAFLSVASLVFTMIVAVIYPQGIGFLWSLFSFVMNFAIFMLVFAMIYRFVPTDKASYKSCWISGSISTVFYLVGKDLIGLYLGHAGLESSYGAAGSLIVLLVWVYYTALTLLFSYEFTRDVIFKKDLTAAT
jgi:membrane protein